MAKQRTKKGLSTAPQTQVINNVGTIKEQVNIAEVHSVTDLLYNKPEIEVKGAVEDKTGVKELLLSKIDELIEQEAALVNEHHEAEVAKYQDLIDRAQKALADQLNEIAALREGRRLDAEILKIRDHELKELRARIKELRTAYDTLTQEHLDYSAKQDPLNNKYLDLMFEHNALQEQYNVLVNDYKEAEGLFNKMDQLATRYSKQVDIWIFVSSVLAAINVYHVISSLL